MLTGKFIIEPVQEKMAEGEAEPDLKKRMVKVRLEMLLITSKSLHV